MNRIENSEVEKVFNCYPTNVRKKLMFLRKLILETALETEGVGDLEETLRWGEPSYVPIQSKSGSTVRIGWEKSNPRQYAMYFHCSTKLVDTFKKIYGDNFKYEGRRAIVFDEDDDVPEAELKCCIALSLTYHRVKHLPMLGV